MQSGSGLTRFRNPDKKYKSPNFKTTKRPNSPSPKNSDYEKKAVTKADKHSRCIYIHPDTGKRCRLFLGIYPKYCHVHTTLIENLFITKSNIKNAGNGLFAGPFGFKKNTIIGEYSMPWMKVKSGRLDNRNGKNTDYNSSYVYCTDTKRGEKEEDAMCYDGLDIRSTIVRNANDAHGSKFKNNAYFDERTGKDGVKHVYVIASKNIEALNEIFIFYGNEYF